jgi:hypothetical protein
LSPVLNERPRLPPGCACVVVHAILVPVLHWDQSLRARSEIECDFYIAGAYVSRDPARGRISHEKQTITLFNRL